MEADIAEDLESLVISTTKEVTVEPIDEPIPVVEEPIAALEDVVECDSPVQLIPLGTAPRAREESNFSNVIVVNKLSEFA